MFFILDRGQKTASRANCVVLAMISFNYLPFLESLLRHKEITQGGQRIKGGLIHLQTHAIVNFIISECNVVFVDRVPNNLMLISLCMPKEKLSSKLQLLRHIPFLQLNLARICTRLGSNEFLEITNGVFRAAFDPDCEVQCVYCQSVIILPIG